MKKPTLLLAGLALAGAAAAQTAPGDMPGNTGATEATATTAAQAAAPATAATAATAATPGGGFTGPVTVVTAAQAKALPDDAKVTLRGNIESHLGGKNYQFKDASGAVTVEIKRKHWDAQTVSPQDMVQIDGEVERKRDAVSIEVKHLRKL